MRTLELAGNLSAITIIPLTTGCVLLWLSGTARFILTAVPVGLTEALLHVAVVCVVAVVFIVVFVVFGTGLFVSLLLLNALMCGTTKGVHTVHVWYNYVSYVIQRRRIAGSQTTCSICLDAFAELCPKQEGHAASTSMAVGSDREVVNVNEVFQTLTLVCGHTFHVDCIQQWTRRQRACPLCQTPV